jgi:hypothetical protein
MITPIEDSMVHCVKAWTEAGRRQWGPAARYYTQDGHLLQGARAAFPACLSSSSNHAD